MALLEVSGLRKSFGGVAAVDGASLSVEEGSITALIGPNGAGKTTAFNLISGVLPLDDGRVEFDGTDVTGWVPHRITRRGMSRTFQITRVLPELTVLENVALAVPVRGIVNLARRAVRPDHARRGAEALEFVGLARLMHEKASSLSYGQRRLLEFAAVLMSEPKLVLLDEPAGGVNPALIDQLAQRIQDMRARGLTFLLVEHNMELVMGLSDSVVVMAQGRVLTSGSPSQVQADPRVVEAYLGGV